MNFRKFQLLMSKYGFSIIIMALELALVFWFFFWLGRWMPTLWIVFVIFFSLATILAIVNRSMTPESKVTWLLVAFVPVIGPLLYLMFGERRLSRGELKQLKNMDQMKFREDNSYELRLYLKKQINQLTGLSSRFSAWIIMRMFTMARNRNFSLWEKRCSRKCWKIYAKQKNLFFGILHCGRRYHVE